MQAMFLTPEGAILDSAIGTLPSLPIPVNFPYYNSFALLPLQGPDYKTQVLQSYSVSALSHIKRCLSHHTNGR